MEHLLPTHQGQEPLAGEAQAAVGDAGHGGQGRGREVVDPADELGPQGLEPQAWGQDQERSPGREPLQVGDGVVVGEAGPELGLHQHRLLARVVAQRQVGPLASLAGALVVHEAVTGDLAAEVVHQAQEGGAGVGRGAEDLAQGGGGDDLRVGGEAADEGREEGGHRLTGGRTGRGSR